MSKLNSYRNVLEKYYLKITCDLLRVKLFTAFGLELTGMNVYFEDNSTFSLTGFTFGYFDPRNNSLHINIEDPFFKNVSERQLISRLIFILFHESHHKLLMHSDRCGTRDKQIFNIAADYEIHNLLYTYCEVMKSALKDDLFASDFNNIYDLLDSWDPTFAKTSKSSPEDSFKGMFDKKLLDKTAEEIYQMILSTMKTETKEFSVSMGGNNSSGSSSENGKSSKDQPEKPGQEASGNGKSRKNKSASESSADNNQEGNSGKESGEKVTVKVTTFKTPDGQEHKSVTIEWPENSNGQGKKSEDAQKSEKDSQSLRKQIMESELTSAAERNKGSMSAECSKFLKKLFKIKIDWEKILKASLQSVLSKSDYFTWARPRMSTYSSLGIYLPDVEEDKNTYGTLIIARDESGSMTDDEVCKAASIIMDAKEHYRQIIILKHDTEIKYEGKFSELTDDVKNMLCTRATCGGTSHKEVFKYIIDYHKKHLYDEEDAISCVILMTDCCSDIQEFQDTLPAKVPMIYMVPAGSVEYAKGVKGKIISVES